jgi:hypothetical protein
MTSVRDYDDRAVADGLNDALPRNCWPAGPQPRPRSWPG